METQDKAQDIYLSIEPLLMQGLTENEMQEKIKTALIFFKYIQGELSIEQVAECYQKSITDTLDWLDSLGVAKARMFRESLKTIGLEESFYEEMVEDLKRAYATTEEAIRNNSLLKPKKPT